MNEIENSSCVSILMTIKPISKIEGKKWGENSIPKKINDEVYICICTVTDFY